MTDISQAIATAVEFEKFGVEFYRRFEKLVDDKDAKLLMRALATDEAEHASLLTRELQELGKKAKMPSKKEIEEGLAEIFPERLSKGHIGVKDSISAIKMGMRTEERSIKCYEKHGAKAGPEMKRVFKKLETMEREHLRLLRENLHYLQSDGSWYGYVPILEG